MKIHTLILLMLLLLFGCKKQETIDPIQGFQGTLSARFDGQLVKFKGVSAWGGSAASNLYPYILIGGIEENSTMDAFYIQVWYEKVPAISTFVSSGDCWADISCLWMDYQLNYDQQDEYSLECGTEEGSMGSIFFTSLEFEEGGLVEGTFSGSFINMATLQDVTVSDGVFKAQIIEMH